MPDTPLSFDANEPLPLTGERTAPGIPEGNYWFEIACPVSFRIIPRDALTCRFSHVRHEA